MIQLAKSLELLRLLIKNPREFGDRISSMAKSRWDGLQNNRHTYVAHDLESGLRLIGRALGADLNRFLQEPALAVIAEHVAERITHMPAEAPFGSFHNGDVLLGRLCYAIGRALEANVIVEAGVCYGVTSSFLLKALQVNGQGILHSIDLPPLGKNGDRFVGWMIPGELRSRWNLHRGTTKRLLGPLLANLGLIGLFIHDSLHTYQNMRNEFAAAWAALRPGGVLIADDIEGNRAFQELTDRPDVSASVVLKEEKKDSLVGVAVKSNKAARLEKKNGGEGGI